MRRKGDECSGKVEGTTLAFRRWFTCYCQISRSHRYPGPQWLCSCHALWCRSSSPRWHRWCVSQSSRRDARKWPAGNTDWGLLPAPASALPRKFNTAHSRPPPKLQVMFCWKSAATACRKYSMEVFLFFLQNSFIPSWNPSEVTGCSSSLIWFQSAFQLPNKYHFWELFNNSEEQERGQSQKSNNWTQWQEKNPVHLSQRSCSVGRGVFKVFMFKMCCEAG